MIKKFKNMFLNDVNILSINMNLEERDADNLNFCRVISSSYKNK